jgi:hypothetical protein
MTFYKYSVAAYDSTSEEDMGILAMDIVFYESAYDSLSESWPEFDAWLDGNYAASDVYRAFMDRDRDSDIARGFASYMAKFHRDEVIESGLRSGIVTVIEEEVVE